MRTALAVALLLCGGALAFPSAPTKYPKKQLYAKIDLRGKKAPALVAETWITGHAPQLKGKTVLVDMWATWCPSCVDLIPGLNKWKKKFGKDLVVIGVSSEEQATVREFMKSHPMTYIVGVDPQQRLQKSIQVEGIPQVLVISPDGIVRWQGFPSSDEDPLTDKKLAQIIAAGRIHRS